MTEMQDIMKIYEKDRSSVAECMDRHQANQVVNSIIKMSSSDQRLLLAWCFPGEEAKRADIINLMGWIFKYSEKLKKNHRNWEAYTASLFIKAANMGYPLAILNLLDMIPNIEQFKDKLKQSGYVY